MKLFFLLFISVFLANAQNGCFPMTRSWGNGPNGTPLKQWWCGSDQLYGFLGFSLPLEDGCDAFGYDWFMSTFKTMKTNYGATFVRIYLPECRQTSFWVDMVKAARDTSMALIPMIFWDWQQNDPVMYAAEDAFMGVFNDNEVGSIAPYIVHSVAFGDELGEEGDYWVSRMRDFKGKLAKYNVSIAITDDWDRDVYENGNGGLSDFGNETNSLDDLTQAHVQPFYHPDVVIDAFHMWDYFTQQMNFMVNNLKRPLIISQTLWAYNKDGHQRGEHDEADNMDNYVEYWNTINNNCQTFKQMKIGWFFHSWLGEPGLDLIGSNGQPVFNFVPKKC
jgi:hypothetical protein